MKNFSKLVDEYLSEFVYGGIDGIVTTFAVVAASAAAGLDTGVILVLGFANLIADGISMGVSAYLAEKSELEQYHKQRRAVVRLLEDSVKKAGTTISMQLKRYGFTGKNLESATKKIQKSDHAAGFIMREKHGLGEAPSSAVGTGMVTFISFLIVGIVPILAYLIDFIFDAGGKGLFLQSCLLAGGAFAGIGWLKSKIADTPIVGSVIETLILGAIAAGAAYIVGSLLEPLFL